MAHRQGDALGWGWMTSGGAGGSRPTVPSWVSSSAKVFYLRIIFVTHLSYLRIVHQLQMQGCKLSVISLVILGLYVESRMLLAEHMEKLLAGL